MDLFSIITLIGGLALFLFGMETMGKGLTNLSGGRMESLLQRMTSSRLKGVLLGLVVTAVIQSSSASVGILQALCATGGVSFAAAVPIIMGQNIGTCVTALLSSIGTNRNARRAAMVHLYFNLIGTILFMAAFYGFHSVIPFDFMAETAHPAGIAVVHTTFNVCATILLFPFGNLLVKLAEWTIPAHESREELETASDLARLDERFLEKPGVAIDQSRIVISNMADRARESMDIAMSMLYGYSDKKASQVTELERRVDRYEDALSKYLVRIAGRDLSELDSKRVSVYLHCIGDFERISDHAVNLMQAFEEMNEKKLVFSEHAAEELSVYIRAVSRIMDLAFHAFQDNDADQAREVEPLEETIDMLNRKIKQKHIDRLKTGECTIEQGFILADICVDLERVADHCSNLAVSVLQSDKGGYDSHAFIRDLRSGNPQFEKEYKELSSIYQLP